MKYKTYLYVFNQNFFSQIYEFAICFPLHYGLEKKPLSAKSEVHVVSPNLKNAQYHLLP